MSSHKPASRKPLEEQGADIFSDRFTRTNAAPEGAPLDASSLDERLEEFGAIAERLNSSAPRSIRLNATGVLLLARQLEELDSKLYEVKFPGMIATEVVPHKTGIDPGAENYTYQSMDLSGRPRRASAQSTDSPDITVAGASDTQGLFSYHASISWTVQELRRFTMAGFGIDTVKTNGARKVFALNQEQIICTGDSEVGMTGIANNASVSLVTPITGSWATPATADQVYADVAKLINAVFSGSKGIHTPNQVLFPPTLWVIIKTLRFSNTGITVLRFLRKEHPEIDFRPWPYLETAGAASVPRILCGEVSPENAEALAPVVFESFAPQIVGTTYKVPLHQRFGGVVVRYPGAYRYMDGC